MFRGFHGIANPERPTPSSSLDSVPKSLPLTVELYTLSRLRKRHRDYTIDERWAKSGGEINEFHPAPLLKKQNAALAQPLSKVTT